MLYKITVLTSLMFAAVYPLCFLISVKDPLVSGFHKFHTGLPVIVAGISVVFLYSASIPQPLMNHFLLWFFILFILSLYYWGKESPNAFIMAIPCLIGIWATVNYQAHLVGDSPEFIWIATLGGLIYCASLFAMNLGHWYLNVHGLPMKHLKNATLVFWILVALRAIWDIFILSTGTIFYNGETISLISFVASIDGIFIFIAIFFGTLFPLIALYFAHETIKLKNTQSTTGILYVILCAVLIGDITYKFYLIRFGLAL